MPSSTEASVIVAYSGVHQAFQIALAAQEMGALDCFYGSVFDASAKWGGRLRSILGREVLISRNGAGFDADKLKEIPIPFLLNRLALRSDLTKGWYSWYQANFDFDRQVASRLRHARCRIFVASETCARDSFRTAGERGMIKVLDCPQVHPHTLTKLLGEAADDLGLPVPPHFDSPELARRKEEEFTMADILLVFSAMHRQTFGEAGYRDKRFVEIPLWVDSGLWYPPPTRREAHPAESLKVLFVGRISLVKGMPYLIRAMEKCSTFAKLILVGEDKGDVADFIARAKCEIDVRGRKNKAELRAIYWEADLVVLPSLIDAFGFVAIEAMACGLPVIVTDNCGVPVPEPSWRVPVMNSDAIAERIHYYATNREALQNDGEFAATFAKQFGPEEYRKRIKELFVHLLN